MEKSAKREALTKQWRIHRKSVPLNRPGQKHIELTDLIQEERK
jgi:hypothetical protein